MSNVEISCANEKCGHHICLSEVIHQRYKQTQETFYCPAGHGNYFPNTDNSATWKKRAQELESKYLDMKEDRNRLYSRLNRTTFQAIDIIRQHAEPGIYVFGDKGIWKCTCGAAGHGSDTHSEDYVSWLWKQHAKRNLCNPIPIPAEVTT